MCGIAGWISWNTNINNQEPIIINMTEPLSNRGPDAQGIWLSENAAFGHRRLSVVDPEGGVQPMIREYSRDKKYVITYNGELYNTQELCTELQNMGHDFYTRSDTEVLLVSYIQWGAECIKRFNGIFAFGIWDKFNKTLFLGRDRAGVKPLFYTENREGFLFASEIKSLLAHPSVKAEIDEDGIAEIFFVGPARTPGCGVYKDIYELKPGSCMIYNREGRKIFKYWSLYSYPHDDDFESTCITVKELLKNAVERQLAADVPVCTFLSGGLDSSAITAFAADYFKKNGLGKLHTYSINYTDNELYFKPSDFEPDSDSLWIKRIVEMFDTEHHYITVDSIQLAEALGTAVHARDLPGMADIDTSLFLFCQEVKKEATVALSGECADEIFGGYPWFYKSELFNADTFPWSLEIAARENLIAPDIKKSIPQAYEYISQRYKDTINEVPRLEYENADEARRRELFYLNLNWFMTTLLDRKDRMSMATGLEVRVPFCDHRLVEYVWNIPWWIKFYNEREKGLLRQALKGILPDDIIERKKSPFPRVHNPAYLFAIKHKLTEILNDTNAPIHKLINTKLIYSILESEENMIFDERPWFGQLMRTAQLFAYLIQVNIWLADYDINIKL